MDIAEKINLTLMIFRFWTFDQDVYDCSPKGFTSADLACRGIALPRWNETIHESVGATKFFPKQSVTNNGRFATSQTNNATIAFRIFATAHATAAALGARASFGSKGNGLWPKKYRRFQKQWHSIEIKKRHQPLNLQKSRISSASNFRILEPDFLFQNIFGIFYLKGGSAQILACAPENWSNSGVATAPAPDSYAYGNNP